MLVVISGLKEIGYLAERIYKIVFRTPIASILAGYRILINYFREKRLDSPSFILCYHNRIHRSGFTIYIQCGHW